jgi:hypothetical protein
LLTPQDERLIMKVISWLSARKYRIALWLAVLQCICALGISAVILFAGVRDVSEAAEAVNYARTPLPIGFVYFVTSQASAYWCFASMLSILACVHLAMRAAGRGEAGRLPGLIYVFSKGALALVVLSAIVVAAIIEHWGGLHSSEVVYRSGGTGGIVLETVANVRVVLVEAFVDLPLLIILLTGSLRR